MAGVGYICVDWTFLNAWALLLGSHAYTRRLLPPITHNLKQSHSGRSLVIQGHKSSQLKDQMSTSDASTALMHSHVTTLP